MHNIQPLTLNPTIPTTNNAINDKNKWFVHLQSQIAANLMSITPLILSTTHEMAQIS